MMRLLFIVILFSLSVFSIGGCSSKPDEPGTNAGAGVLAVKLSTTGPGKHITEYVIAGAGPGRAFYYKSSMHNSNYMRKLVPGVWDIVVDGIDYHGKVVARGYSTVIIEKGRLAIAPIKIRKLTGAGKLELDVMWDIFSDRKKVKIEGSLWQFGRKPVPLHFSSNQGLAVCRKYIKTGYYDLVIRLKQNRKYTAGAVKTVKIINGGRTRVWINIAKSNLIDFSTAVTPRISASYSAAIRGVDKNTSHNSIKAFVEHKIPGDVVISWYLDGRYVQNGDMYFPGKTLASGDHRLDVSVFKLNGRFGTSASKVIQVADFHRLISFKDTAEAGRVKVQ